MVNLKRHHICYWVMLFPSAAAAAFAERFHKITSDMLGEMFYRDATCSRDVTVEPLVYVLLVLMIDLTSVRAVRELVTSLKFFFTMFTKLTGSPHIGTIPVSLYIVCRLYTCLHTS